ncbi:hypothetical protein HK098_008279 [Nowakowskiella sp. JEL0407]|nr:hypothetical protein HK098_008279 [Nowakowskiella sp. JEL0407]
MKFTKVISSASLLTGTKRFRKIDPSTSLLSAKNPPPHYFSQDGIPSIVFSNLVSINDNTAAWKTYSQRLQGVNPSEAPTPQIDYLSVIKLLSSPKASESVLGYGKSKYSKGLDLIKGTHEFYSLLSMYSIAPHITHALRQVLADVNNTETYSSEIGAEIVKILASTGNISSAVRFVKEQPRDLQQNQAVYEALIQELAQSGRVEFAHEILTALQSSDLKVNDNTIASVIRGYGRLRQTEEAQKLFSTSFKDQSRPSVVLYEAIIDVYGKSGEVGAAQSFLRELRSSYKSTTTEAWAGLINAFAESRNAGGAADAYRQMRLEGVAASSRTLEHMIRVHGTTKDLAGAVKYFYKKESVDGFVPDIGMCEALVDAYMVKGDILPAWRLIREIMKLRTPPLISSPETVERDENGTWALQWSWIPPNIIRSLAFEHSEHDPQYLYDMLKFAEFDSGLYPHATFAAVISVIHALAKSASDDHAKYALSLFSAFDALPSETVPSSSFVYAILAHAKLGNAKDAQKVYDSMVNNLETNAKRGDTGNVTDFLFKNVQVSQDAYNGLVRAYVNSDDMSKALELVNAAVKEYAESDVLTVGDTLLPHPDANTFESLLAGIYEHKPDVNSKDKFEKLLVKQKDKVIKEIIRDVVKMGVIPDPSQHIHVARALQQVAETEGKDEVNWIVSQMI